MGQPARLTIAALVAVAASIACQSRAPDPPEPIPAPPLRELTDTEIKSTMARLASHMVVVDEMIQVADPVDEEDRNRLVRELDAMLKLVDSFGRDALDPRHEKFGWRMRGLRSDLNLARAAVYAEPPEYDLVRAVSSSCTHCHKARRKPAGT